MIEKFLQPKTVGVLFLITILLYSGALCWDHFQLTSRYVGIVPQEFPQGGGFFALVGYIIRHFVRVMAAFGEAFVIYTFVLLLTSPSKKNNLNFPPPN
jgi:hypothetical protein